MSRMFTSAVSMYLSGILLPLYGAIGAPPTQDDCNLLYGPKPITTEIQGSSSVSPPLLQLLVKTYAQTMQDQRTRCAPLDSMVLTHGDLADVANSVDLFVAISIHQNGHRGADYSACLADSASKLFAAREGVFHYIDECAKGSPACKSAKDQAFENFTAALNANVPQPPLLQEIDPMTYIDVQMKYHFDNNAESGPKITMTYGYQAKAGTQTDNRSWTCDDIQQCMLYALDEPKKVTSQIKMDTLIAKASVPPLSCPKLAFNDTGSFDDRAPAPQTTADGQAKPIRDGRVRTAGLPVGGNGVDFN